MTTAVAIDWHMPDIKMRLMFRRLRRNLDRLEKRTEHLRRLVRIVCESEGREEFIEREANAGLEFGLAYFSAFDENCVGFHRAAFDEWADFNRDVLVRDPSARTFLAEWGVAPDASIAQISEAMTNQGFWYFMIIHAFGRKFASEQHITGRRKVGNLVS